jgi:hypothetical protein
MPFVYVNKDGTLYKDGISDRLKWLEELTVHAKTRHLAEEEAFKTLDEKYPEYKGHIWLF